MAINPVAKLREKYRRGLLLYYLSGRLNRFGIVVQPFYLVSERQWSTPSPLPPPYRTRFLDAEEAAALHRTPQVDGDETLYRQRLQRGDRCFALFCGERLAGYVWCDTAFCRSWLEFPLDDNEAYLFGQVVFDEHRGAGLAPLLRQQLYRTLEAEGRDRFISATNAFNTPAKRFKEKLRAEPVKLCLAFHLFGRFKKVLPLKTYPGARFGGLRD